MALAQQLLPDLPGFVNKGRLVFQNPIGHILRGICFEPSAFDKKPFYASTFIMLMCVPTRYISLSLGHRIRNAGIDGWRVDLPDLVPNLRVAIKQQVSQFLSLAQSLLDVADIAKGFQSQYAKEVAAYAFARSGDIGNAVCALDHLLYSLDASVPWQHGMAERAKLLRANLQSDPAKAQLQLDSWEMETFKNLGLEEFK